MKKKQPIIKEKEGNEMGLGLDSIIHTKTGLFVVRDMLPTILKKNTISKPFTPLRSEGQMKIKYLGRQPGYRIITASGRTYTVQGMYPLIGIAKKAKLGPVLAGYLKPGSEFFVPLGGAIEEAKMKLPFSIKTQEETEAFLTFIGWYLRCGSILDGWFIFSKDVPTSIAENLNKISSLGKIKPRELKKDQFWSFNCSELVMWVKEYCKEEQFKVIPSLILSTTSVENLRILLRALMVKHHCLWWHVTHESLTLVYQVLEILARMEIYARVELEKRFSYSGLPTLTISMPYMDAFSAFINGVEYKRKIDRSSWVVHSPMAIYKKFAAEDRNVNVETVLSKNEIELCKSLIEQKAVRQVVVKVEKINAEFVELVIDGNGK